MPNPFVMPFSEVPIERVFYPISRRGEEGDYYKKISEQQAKCKIVINGPSYNSGKVFDFAPGEKVRISKFTIKD